MPKLAVLGRPVRVLRVSPNYKTNFAVMMCDYGHTRWMTEVMRRKASRGARLASKAAPRVDRRGRNRHISECRLMRALHDEQATSS